MATTAASTSSARCGARPFLVEITFDAVVIPSERREAILQDERQRGRELMRKGRIERVWRIPGTSNSMSIWSAASRAELDAWLQTLPIAPWSEFQIIDLERHPLECEEERT